MNKVALRKIYLNRRKSLKSEELERRNKKIEQNLFKEIDFNKIEVIHTFLPIHKNNEINVWPILSHLRDNFKNIKIIVSKSDFNTLEMKHFIFKEDTILLENNVGIPEPHQGEIYLDTKFDIILIPLVVFDLQGHRVGYGKGFYDRFLGGCNPEAKKVGLSLFEPVTNIQNVNEYDIKLNHCATPEFFYTFQNKDI